MALTDVFRGRKTGGSPTSAGSGNAIGADPALRSRILDEYERIGIGWIWATDKDGKICFLSDPALESLDTPVGDIIGQSVESVFEVDPDNPDQLATRPLGFQFKSHKKVREQIVRFALGRSSQAVKQTWWSITGFPMHNDSGDFIGYRGSAKDVTREYERKIADSRLAEFDSLTGLANRHSIYQTLDGILSSYQASGRSCALMMLDLDKFKRVNDTLGHQVGDLLLVEVAQRLESIIGNKGIVARLGGDEFQVVLKDMDDRGALGELADKVIQIISQPYSLGEKRAIIGTSVGVAIAPFDGDNREDLIRSADLALYAAKNGGRAAFRFYSSDLKDEEEVRQMMLDELRVALEEDQLHLVYQPVVSIESGNVVGLEALMRWTHPERGNISPGQFIPIAEDSDLINNLGEWALRTACEAAKQWPDTVKIAVNVSAVQFANPGFPTVVANTLAHSGLAAGRLELELTESIFVGDDEEIEQTFAQLKGLGVRLALDDFGTGYSSLSYLRSAPFDKIKVDKSFVDSCTQNDKNSAKIIAAIIGLSNALNMETTVEGVEAFDQLEVVKEKGAQMIQGFLYSRPITPDSVTEYFESGDFSIEPAGPDVYRPDRRSVYQRVGVIHEDYYYNAVMRDLSRSGAGLEGIVGLERGTQLVLDMGEGQLAVSTVARVDGAEFGLEFEAPLVDDGAGGLCTRHRVSRYTIKAAGLPKKPGTAGPEDGKRNESKPLFMEVAAGG